MGGPLSERPTTTYVYSFADGVVTTLPANPLVEVTTPADVLQFTRPDLELPTGLLNQPIHIDLADRPAAIEASPSGNYVAYRLGNVPAATYRLVDIPSAREFELDITVRDLESDGVLMALVDIVWAEEIDTFVVQGTSGLTNAYLPATLNTITDEGIDSRQLTDLEPLSGSEYLEFTVHGLSPSGRYLIIDSLLPFPDGSEFPDPRYSRIIDIETEESIDLRMNFRSTPQVAWLSDDTFRAHTTLGVIDYSISTQSFEVVLTPEFMEDIHRTSFSFDGSYMIGEQRIESEVPGGDETVVVACSFR